MGFVDHAKVLLRALLIRIGLVLLGCAALIISIQLNFDAGPQVVAGLFSPDSFTDIVVSVARLAAPTFSLWLIYRGLR